MSEERAVLGGPSGRITSGLTTSSETAEGGRAFRMLVVLDAFTRRCLAVVVTRRLQAEDVLQ